MTDMTLILTYRSEDRPEDEREEFNPDRLVDPTAPVRTRGGSPALVTATTPEEAEAWGRAILQRFNGSRTRGEAVRAFVSAELKTA